MYQMLMILKATPAIYLIILYNHRLYDSYGTKEFIEFVKKNQDLVFLVTDPMMNRGTDRSRYNISPMTNRLALQELDNVKILDGSNRMDYIQAIDSCKIAIAPYRRACVWSMAVIDCFCRGLPVIGPNFASFNEIIPDFLRYETVSKERLLVDKLLTALSEFNGTIISISHDRMYLDEVADVIYELSDNGLNTVL